MMIEELDSRYRPAVERHIEREWAGPMMATRGRLTDTRACPGLVATERGWLAGALLYEIRGDDCEVVALFSLESRRGTGGALLHAVRAVAAQAGCRRVWLVTTNDNLAALRFYQRQRWRLCAVRLGAMAENRRLKPGIPLKGAEGIPIEHEFEFEWVLRE